MFKLNGKDYKDIELSFNDICELQEKGVDLASLNEKNALRTIRALISLRFNGNEEVAGNEIQAHIENGGSFEDLVGIIQKAVENSGFFQALNKK